MTSTRSDAVHATGVTDPGVAPGGWGGDPRVRLLRLELAIRAGTRRMGRVEAPGVVTLGTTGEITLIWPDTTTTMVSADEDLDELIGEARYLEMDLTTLVALGRRLDSALVLVHLSSWPVLGIRGPRAHDVILSLLEDLGSLSGRRPPIWCWRLPAPHDAPSSSREVELARIESEATAAASRGETCVVACGERPRHVEARLLPGVVVITGGAVTRGLELRPRGPVWRLDPLGWDLVSIVGLCADSSDGVPSPNQGENHDLHISEPSGFDTSGESHGTDPAHRRPTRW